MDLTLPCTQKEFADLVGVGQPVVSELLTRGVIQAKDPARIWLLAYTAHLREQAAGRGGDGMLALNRAAESATRNGLLQIKLKTARGEYAPIDAIQQVLAYVGTRVASKLEPLPARIKMLCPQLTADDIKGVENAITDARNLAVSAALNLLEIDDAEIDDKVTAA